MEITRREIPQSCGGWTGAGAVVEMGAVGAEQPGQGRFGGSWSGKVVEAGVEGEISTLEIK